MWGNAFTDDDPLNPTLADEYGIVDGHVAPRADDAGARRVAALRQGPVELRDQRRGPARRSGPRASGASAAYENIVTLGMRGDGDEPMSRGGQHRAARAHRRRPARDHRRGAGAATSPTVPQVWALYKEVQEYYEKGMRVPDDVTLLWCDDNWGNIRRLPTAEERKRGRRLRHLLPLRLRRRAAQLQVAQHDPDRRRSGSRCTWPARYGADRIWIVNVGDIKPMEFPIQFFLDYAWDPERWPAERLAEYTRAWAEREFGAEHAAEIAEIVDALHDATTAGASPRCSSRGRTASSTTARRRRSSPTTARWRERAEALYAALPADATGRLLPARAVPGQGLRRASTSCTSTAGRNRLYAVQGRASTNDLAERGARAVPARTRALSRDYNETLAGGKWNHMMDQTHIGYTYWQQPVRNAMPAVQEIQVPAAAEMGVAIEGSEASWPGGAGGPAALPALSVFDRQPRYVEVFNRGQQPFELHGRGRASPGCGSTRRAAPSSASSASW